MGEVSAVDHSLGTPLEPRKEAPLLAPQANNKANVASNVIILI